jgi:hypothetical protein
MIKKFFSLADILYLQFILTVTVLVLGALISLFLATHLIFLLFISRPNLTVELKYCRYLTKYRDLSFVFTAYTANMCIVYVRYTSSLSVSISWAY